MSLIGETQSPDDLIKDGTDASFIADVIEASKETPVIVDFWATWCGPCRQLGPSIEKNVLAAKGKVKLVKIDIDQNPQFAGQLRVQSIPAVFAFVGGRPVDGFMGALPDSQVKQFVDRIAGQAPANATDELLAMAKESLDVGDVGGAAQAYAQVLQGEPDNVKAIGGLARCYLAGGDAERAAEVAAMAPEGAKDADLDSVRAALALAEEGPSETGAFEQRLAKDPNDHEARYEIAKALAARGAWAEASDHLLTIIAADREWNDGAARAKLLSLFEAVGLEDPWVAAQRRRLSLILFG